MIIASSGRVQAQTYTQYKIQLNSDGSAALTIIQVSGLNGTVDTWADFQQKVTALVAAAATQTHRQMSVDNDTFQTSTTITSSDSKTTEYMFTWQNISKTENGRLITGDVFSVSGFFNQLYGDGALQIIYPANYTLESVTPTPDERDDSTQTLQWLGTQFFVAEQPSIILVAQDQASANSGQQPYLLIGSVSAVVAAVAVAGWFFLVYRRRKQSSKELPVASTMTLLETEEEKVIRVLRSNGGSAYQSAITEQCRFSKAKTSQLLTALEAKGVVRRYKKGRDKIVNLNEQAKGEK
ncbi:MAG: hypothetical protein ABSD42_01420 [Candidatus Bathyarchaeia archaeon]